MMDGEFFITNATSFRKLRIIEDESSVKLTSADCIGKKLLIHTAVILILIVSFFFWDLKNQHGIFSEPKTMFFIFSAGALALLAPNALFVLDHLKFHDFIIKYDKTSSMVFTKYGEPLSVNQIEKLAIYSMILGKPNRQQVQIILSDHSQSKRHKMLVYASAFSLSSGELHESFMDFSRRIGKPLIIKSV